MVCRFYRVLLWVCRLTRSTIWYAIVTTPGKMIRALIAYTATMARGTEKEASWTDKH